jgi:signal transduction histidine kinase/ActR/RegA family two-component response regulator
VSWQITGLLFSSTFELVMLFIVRGRLRTFTAGPFCLALLCNAIWALGYAIELLTPTLEGKMLVFQIRCSALAFYVVAWIEVIYRMTRDRPLLKGWTLAAMLIVPLTTLVLLWIPGPGQNPILRHTFWVDEHSGIGVLRCTLGPWGLVYYFFNYAAWGWIAMMLYPQRGHSGWERRARLAILLAAMIGWSADQLHLFGISQPTGLNYAPMLFPITSTLIAVALFKHRLLVLAPVARAALIEQLEDRIVVLDEFGVVVDYNKAAATTLNLPKDRALGGPASEMLARWPDLTRLISSTGTRRAETTIGSLVFEASLFPVAEHAHARAQVLILRNITHLKESENQLRVAKEIAENAGHAQSRFLATMSHEIRTPMNGVVGCTQLLKDTTLTAQQRDYLDLIEQSSSSLLVIINDVLDYSKITANQLEIEYIRCEVRAIIEQSCRLFHSAVHKSGISLTPCVSPRVPAAIIGDSVRISQILNNLLGNAVKFTRAGGIVVDVDMPVSDLLVIKVADTGIGIDPEHQARIFTPFSQADTSTTRRFGGTGLGLSISRNLCELMGGSLTVNSRPGEGSVFTATLRAQPDKGSPSSLLAFTPKASAESVGLNLLVCEDNPVNQTVIRAFLARLGHRVSLVDNGEKALQAIKQESFDAVLMDLEMPVMDGYEAVRCIRESETNSGTHLRIIALTAHALKGERERCLALGMDDFLTKPVSLAELEAALGRTHPAPEDH